MLAQRIPLPAPDTWLDTYLLSPSREMPHVQTRPAVLVLPGGGYSFCSAREAEPVAMAFAAQGYHTFVLQYSLGKDSSFAQARTDAEAALTHIRSNAAAWGVRPQQIAAIGFSAGGHLAAALAVGRGEQRPGQPEPPRPNALILGYPCTLAEINEVLAFPVPSLPELVDAQTPPTFLFSTSNDRTVPIRHSLAFLDALEKAGVPFEAHIFAGGDHGYSLATPAVCADQATAQRNAPNAAWLPQCCTWLAGLFPLGG
ncbi:MAG: alpha/beta hydrolase [Oscillospiraceae bacterium]|jgi:acetyl esterase/lipase|nr:alpha/beta hydrolase [Oscillospiraceae bacterium]